MTENDSSNDAAFHRPPRAFPPPVPTEQISLAPPSATHDSQHEGLLSVLFPVVGSLSLFAFALVYKNRLFLYVACAIVAISILFTLAMRWSRRRRGRRSARRRRRRYREYLAGQEARLERIAQLQLASALRRHPDPQGLWASVVRREHLWERRPGDADFLSVRAGRAPVAHAARPKVDPGHDPLAEYEQALLDEARDVAEIWGTVDDVPVAVALRAAPVLAVVGPRERASACARAMLMQLATWHAPSDLRLAVAHASRDEDWDWAKWLPHIRRDGADAAPAPRIAVATDAASLSALLDEHVAPRLEQLRTLATVATGRDAQEIDAPQLVLVVDGLHPSEERARIPLLREVLARGRELRVALICTVLQPGDEPAETSARLRLAERGPATLEETGPAGYVQRDVRVDEVAPGAAEAVARSLAPVRLQEQSVAGALDARDGLLGLLGWASIDALDTRAEWARRPRSLALRATIGVDGAGRRLELDLKQAAEGGMGPHGLVIGATGSGKSELLRTLVASLALAHPPDELAFVFVDFKGGAAFAELEALPHTAGLITNLQSDLRLVDRMHAALHGEQERRQRILRDAGNVDDVIAYRGLRERDPSLPPVPDLLVVIDEFGELLASRPEYIDLFVAIGRVGRSLGIHLLFSSQRFDEGRLRGLESHLRYRICLRTFSPLESKGVLGTADAYVLPPEPGLGYLKVDTGVYERFHAVLVGEPRSARATPGSRADAVVPFTAGAPATSGLVPARGAGTHDLRRIVRRLRDAHAGGQVHQVWSPPLDAAIALDTVAATAAFWERSAAPAQLAATVGVVDIPREQRTEPLVLDLAGTAGHLAVVGAPQSGKSTLLRTLVLDLARTQTPEELQVLAIDLGGGLLRGLGGLPHVGAVAGKADRELVHRVVARARAEIEAREAAFRRLGLDSMADVHERRRAGAEVPCGHLVLVVDGWAALRRDFQDLDLAIEELLGSGLTYGVHVAVTANRWGELRPSVSDNLGARLELRLNDPIESEIGRHEAAALPTGLPGRGLARGGLEFQAALPRLDGRPTAHELGAAVDAATGAIAARWSGPPAAPVLVLPRVLEPSSLATGGGGAAGVALGVEEERLETVRIDLGGPDAHLLVLGDGESGRTNVLRAFVEGLADDPARPRALVVDPRRTLADVARLAHVQTHATTATGAAQAVDELVDVARERAAQVDAGGAPRPGPPLYLVVDDYDLLAGPEGNPLAPLTSLLARGRDLGLHVVLARRVGGVTRASFEPFFRQLLELRSPGLVLSGDPAEGPLLDGHRAQALPPGRALLVRRGRPPVHVQTVLAPPPQAVAAPPPRLTLAGGGMR
jgi:S-DNA-T family DNA segregation ATPase FtsK/SpoIIIE